MRGARTCSAAKLPTALPLACPPALPCQVWSRLPHGCQAAWEALLARRLDGQGEEPLSAPELRQLLDSCAADAEEEDEGQPAVSSADPAAAQRGGGAAVAPHAGSPSWEGSAVRDEAAAAALGLTGRQASGSAGSGSSGRRRGAAAATFKSLGGAFKGMAKDVASVGRSQLKSLAGGGRGPQPLVAAVAGISDGEGGWAGWWVPLRTACFHGLLALPAHCLRTACRMSLIVCQRLHPLEPTQRQATSIPGPAAASASTAWWRRCTPLPRRAGTRRCCPPQSWDATLQRWAATG